jgi:recombinational DNA repair protein RecT
MSTGLQERPAATTLAAWIDRPEIHARLAAAVGDVMDVDQFIAHVMVAFQDPKVKSCTPLSQFTALHQLAALGLLPTLGQVALVPYKDTIKCSPQWQGYKALMERHPSILEVQAVLVHKRDSFTFHNGEIIHDYDPFDAARIINATSDIKGGYCKIIYRDGRPPKYHTVTAEHIEKCRRCAETQNVWTKWPEQMMLKTVYRDCYARRAVPIDPLVNARLQAVVNADDIDLGNDPQRIACDAPQSQPQQLSKSEQLAKQLATELPPSEGINAERKPGEDAESLPTQPPAPTSPTPLSRPQDEADTIAQWKADVSQLNSLGELTKAKQTIPAEINEAGRVSILSAIEMREASIRGNRGQRSNQKSFVDGGASATEE